MVDPEEVIDLLADEYAYEILRLANQDPMTAQELAEACDAHHSTIYRRIERLQENNLLTEQMQIDPEGHHRAQYSTTFREISVVLDGEGYDVSIKTHEDAADRVAQMWRQMRGEQ